MDLKAATPQFCRFLLDAVELFKHRNTYDIGEDIKTFIQENYDFDIQHCNHLDRYILKLLGNNEDRKNENNKIDFMLYLRNEVIKDFCDIKDCDLYMNEKNMIGIYVELHRLEIMEEIFLNYGFKITKVSVAITKVSVADVFKDKGIGISIMFSTMLNDMLFLVNLKAFQNN